MNKQMRRQKVLGLTLDIFLLISIFVTNDIHYLKFVGMVAIIILMGDTLLNKV
jgi:hypothetical protein